MDIQIGKVGRDRTRRSGKSAKPASSKPARKAGGTEITFSRKLLETRREGLREELDRLLVGIDEQAKEIEKSLTFETLRIYRELVRKFVGICVNELFEVNEKLSVSPAGKKKSLLLVKKIDEELEKLADDFLNRQHNLIGFLGRLDQIKGMLLDLYS